MFEGNTADPADTIVAWEAVEELLSPVPEGPSKEALRMIAAGFKVSEIAAHLHLTGEDVEVLVARARIRVLTDAVKART